MCMVWDRDQKNIPEYYRGPVGRRVERADAQGEELGLWVRLMIWGSPTPWNIVCHLRENEEMARKVKTGLECERSTKSQPWEGEKWPEKPKCGKCDEIKKNLGETNSKRSKSKKLHRNEVSIGWKCSKRDELRKSNDETGVKRKKTEKGRGENALEREGMKFRLEGSKKIGFETLF